MKNLIVASILALATLISCKKESVSFAPDEHEKTAYRILAIGIDTTISTTMFARTETVGLAAAADSKLRATLIAYSNGVYTLQVENLQACQVIIRWSWEDILINNITPSSDVVPANGTVVFTLTGSAHTGKISLKSFGDCGNSSNLIINITEQILPIKLVGNTAKYDEKTGKTTISFDIEEPQLTDWVIIQRLNDAHEWVEALLIASDHTTKQYNISL